MQKSLCVPSERMPEELPEGLLVADATNTIRWANPAMAEITGWTIGELTGKPLKELISPEEIARIATARGLTDIAALERLHCLLRTKAGEDREVSVSIGRSKDAAAPSAIYLVRDIGRQRQIERQLLSRLADKQELDAFGRVASLVVHDLRKFTNILGITAKNLRRYLENPEFREDAIQALETVVSQINQLTNRLSWPQTQPGLNRERTDLRSLVSAVVDLLGKTDRRSATISTNLKGLDRPLACTVNVAEMQRVILNLLLNAYDALENGGEVVVAGRTVAESGHVELLIEDTGVGLPQAYLENSLFRPLQSTKPGGLGLGLYEAKLIVDAHSGTIEVTNRSDRSGARVVITLPANHGERATT